MLDPSLNTTRTRIYLQITCLPKAAADTYLQMLKVNVGEITGENVFFFLNSSIYRSHDSV